MISGKLEMFVSFPSDNASFPVRLSSLLFAACVRCYLEKGNIWNDSETDKLFCVSKVFKVMNIFGRLGTHLGTMMVVKEKINIDIFWVFSLLTFDFNTSCHVYEMKATWCSVVCQSSNYLSIFLPITYTVRCHIVQAFV